MGPEMESAEPHQCGTGEQQRVAGPIVPLTHDGGGAEGGQRVAAGKAGRRRLSYRNATIGQPDVTCDPVATAR